VISEDEEWPAALRSTGLLAPLGLWVRGPARLDDVLQRAVTVIGARASTAYGEYVAGDLGAGLTDREWTVVSWGGLGIDAAVHRGALTGSPGTTVMVARGGLDRPYPHANADLFGHIVDRGGLLVSESASGSGPTAWRSLRGSQLLAMLSAAVVVVEALVRTGTRPTVKAALAIPRPVFAVPGPVTSALSVGCHQLINTGEARVATGPSDLLAVLNSQQGWFAADPVRRRAARAGLRAVGMHRGWAVTGSAGARLRPDPLGQPSIRAAGRLAVP
jgi:DNA processing protein